MKMFEILADCGRSVTPQSPICTITFYINSSICTRINRAFALLENNIVAFALFNASIFMHFDYGILGT